jgi:hypothetical protein
LFQRSSAGSLRSKPEKCNRIVTCVQHSMLSVRLTSVLKRCQSMACGPMILFQPGCSLFWSTGEATFPRTRPIRVAQHQGRSSHLGVSPWATVGKPRCFGPGRVEPFCRRHACGGFPSGFDPEGRPLVGIEWVEREPKGSNVNATNRSPVGGLRRWYPEQYMSTVRSRPRVRRAAGG